VPVTEAEAAAAVTLLPQHSWLRRYVVHGLNQTTAPLVYHLGVGMTVLGTTCPLAYGMPYAGTLRANNFCLLVGRSGEDQKSSALSVGKEILDSAAAPLIGDFPGSPEGLIDSLARRPSQFIPISEFGKFLSSAQRGYFEPTKTLLADLWDSQATQRTKANNKTVRVDNPRLSIGAACSIPYLEKHTLAEDWTGGFMGRWMVLYGKRERNDPDPIGDKTHFQWLSDEVRKRATTSTAGFCLGLDDQAGKVWADWYNNVTNRKLPENIIGIRSRAPSMARKMALVYGWDFGPALAGNPWQMGLDVLQPAIALVELHIKSLVHLSEVIAEHPDARLRRSVMQAILIFGGICTLGQILSVMKMRKRPVVEMLDALMEEGRVTRQKTSLGIVYTLHSRRGDA
jgi:hypothetical protein